MLAFIISTLLAAASATVYTPRVPVIVDREFNVVSEIVIPRESAGRVSGEVEVSLDGIPLKAVKDIRLVYLGTISPVMSRTKSNVMKSHYNYWGAGQEDWYSSRSSFVEHKTKPRSGTVTLPFDRQLVKGDNHFYVSLNINSSGIDLTDTFSCKVKSLTINGEKATIDEHGPSGERRYGIALRNHGDDGVDTYRIPGLARMKSGNLIAVYDIRWNTYYDLQADIDIGYQISKDGGRSWSKMRVAMDMGEYDGLPKDQNGTGDPCVLVDEVTGDIFVFAIWAHGLEGRSSIFASSSGLDPIDVAQLVMVKSADEGKTWSKPVIITPQVKNPASSTLFQGPGCGITMSDGTLVVPIQEWDKDKNPSGGIMYSKDHGETWAVSSMAVDHVCEDQVAEIAPGVLMLNMRNHGSDDRARKVYVTSDLGKTWTPHVSNNTLTEPVCQASLLKAGENLLLFANPDSKVTRNMFTIKASDDLGETWGRSLLLDEEGGWGYSSMAMIDDETVGILYEGSQSHLVYQVVKIADIR
ncbi:MAG: exo-alpha-sialidase [Bacteroidales bacterium]|nr:exo-alpha-sialidase [Bacteroidales bacterium]